MEFNILENAMNSGGLKFLLIPLVIFAIGFILALFKDPK